MKRLVYILVLITAALLVSNEWPHPTYSSSASAQTQKVCHIEGSIRVDYDPLHPYRIGIVEVNEDCIVNVKFEELTPSEFAELSRPRKGTSENNTASQTPPQLRDPNERYVSVDTGNLGNMLPSPPNSLSPALNAPALVHDSCPDWAWGCTWGDVRGRQIATHLVGGQQVHEVEVGTSFEWWWNDVNVLDYYDGWGRRWAGNCWDFEGSLSVWWRTEYMPQSIGLTAQSSFGSEWFCTPGWGGWLRTTTWGDSHSHIGVGCEHNFVGPPPQGWKCFWEWGSVQDL